MSLSHRRNRSLIRCNWYKKKKTENRFDSSRYYGNRCQLFLASKSKVGSAKRNSREQLYFLSKSEWKRFESNGKSIFNILRINLGQEKSCSHLEHIFTVFNIASVSIYNWNIEITRINCEIRSELAPLRFSSFKSGQRMFEIFLARRNRAVLTLEPVK